MVPINSSPHRIQLSQAQATTAKPSLLALLYGILLCCVYQEDLWEIIQWFLALQ